MKSTRKNILSPLRYPGSKKRLSQYIEKVIELNQIDSTLFVELFAGGSSISLYLLENNLVNSIGLVEKDPLVASFWQVVFSKNPNDLNWLIEQVSSIDISVEKWNELKKATPNNKRERAFACLFLNRTSFSGIIAPSSGPIGGQNQESEYKIDCRFPREKIICRLQQAASLRNKVKFVWNLHWKNGLMRIKKMQNSGSLPENILYYLDPPFFHKADRLYSFYFSDKDHEILRDTVLSLQDHWILSYDYCDDVRRLYENNELTHIELLYSASQNAGSKVAKEVIISNLTSLPTNEIKLWQSTEDRKNGDTNSITNQTLLLDQI